jgi:hypothetical protein
MVSDDIHTTPFGVINIEKNVENNKSEIEISVKRMSKLIRKTESVSQLGGGGGRGSRGSRGGCGCGGKGKAFLSLDQFINNV